MKYLKSKLKYPKGLKKKKNLYGNKHLIRKINFLIKYFSTFQPKMSYSNLNTPADLLFHYFQSIQNDIELCIRTILSQNQLTSAQINFITKSKLLMLEKLNEYKKECETIYYKNSTRINSEFTELNELTEGENQIIFKKSYYFKNRPILYNAKNSILKP